MPTKYYCPDCECEVTFDTAISASINGCYHIGGTGGFGLEGEIGGQGNASGDNPGGNSSGAVGVTGNLPIGFNLPFGLGLNSFLNDMMKFLCEKVLPNGLCKIAKTIIIIILILLAIAVIIFLKRFISPK